MWPLERRCNVLRIGRERVELWRDTAHGLLLRATSEVCCAGVPASSDLEQPLAQALRSPMGNGEPVRRVDIVFESAWLPVMAFEVGDALTTRARAQALLRHRINELHETREPFELGLDYRVGDRCALGYALASSVRRMTLDQVRAAGAAPASMLPAFAWGWARLSRHRRRRPTGWWCWAEQDRSLIAHWRGSRIQSLNAGAAPAAIADELLCAIEAESVVRGVVKELDIVHADWRLAMQGANSVSHSGRLTAIEMAVPDQSLPAAVAPPVWYASTAP